MVSMRRMKVDGAQNNKIGEEVTAPRGKGRVFLLTRKRKMRSEPDSICDCSYMSFRNVIGV